MVSAAWGGGSGGADGGVRRRVLGPGSEEVGSSEGFDFIHLTHLGEVM